MRTFLTEAFKRLEGKAGLRPSSGSARAWAAARHKHGPLGPLPEPDLWDRVIGYFQEVWSLGRQRQDVPGYLDHRQTIRRTARPPRLHADDGDGHRTKDAAAALLKGMAENDSV